MIFAVEIWTVAEGADEEPCETECIETREFKDIDCARACAWDAMEEGFFTRLWSGFDDSDVPYKQHKANA